MEIKKLNQFHGELEIYFCFELKINNRCYIINKKYRPTSRYKKQISMKFYILYIVFFTTYLLNIQRADGINSKLFRKFKNTNFMDITISVKLLKCNWVLHLSRMSQILRTERCSTWISCCKRKYKEMERLTVGENLCR